jgi:hypothetical protein
MVERVTSAWSSGTVYVQQGSNPWWLRYCHRHGAGDCVSETLISHKHTQSRQWLQIYRWHKQPTYIIRNQEINKADCVCSTECEVGCWAGCVCGGGRVRQGMWYVYPEVPASRLLYYHTDSCLPGRGDDSGYNQSRQTGHKHAQSQQTAFVKKHFQNNTVQ